MLIDSHCHLPNNEDDARLWLENAAVAGVEKLINIGTSLTDSVDAVSAAEKYPQVYATAAVYPHEDIGETTANLKTQLQKIISSSEKVVAVGECGVDISNWEEGRPLNDQLEIFEMQINLALENKLPLIIHNRNGDEQVLELLQKYDSTGLTGVAHCFSTSWEVAKRLLNLNFYLSFSGMITYPSRNELLETVKNVPDDRYLVETDAPYLAPQGYRGQKNEPKYVKIVAQKVAEVRNLPLEAVEKATFDNTSRLFKL